MKSCTVEQRISHILLICPFISFFFLSKQISSESVTTSDGYRRGYVSFAHSLLYLLYLQTEVCSGSLTEIIQGVVAGADGCVFTYGYSKLGKSIPQPYP